MTQKRYIFEEAMDYMERRIWTVHTPRLHEKLKNISKEEAV